MFGSSFLFIPFSPGSGASGVPPFRRLGEGEGSLFPKWGTTAFPVSPAFSALRQPEAVGEERNRKKVAAKKNNKPGKRKQEPGKRF